MRFDSISKAVVSLRFGSKNLKRKVVHQKHIDFAVYFFGAKSDSVRSSLRCLDAASADAPSWHFS